MLLKPEAEGGGLVLTRAVAVRAHSARAQQLGSGPSGPMSHVWGDAKSGLFNGILNYFLLEPSVA